MSSPTPDPTPNSSTGAEQPAVLKYFDSGAARERKISVFLAWAAFVIGDYATAVLIHVFRNATDRWPGSEVESLVLSIVVATAGAFVAGFMLWYARNMVRREMSQRPLILAPLVGAVHSVVAVCLLAVAEALPYDWKVYGALAILIWTLCYPIQVPHVLFRWGRKAL
jgi:hypothetical protein